MSFPPPPPPPGGFRPSMNGSGGNSNNNSNAQPPPPPRPSFGAQPHPPSRATMIQQQQQQSQPQRVPPGRPSHPQQQQQQPSPFQAPPSPMPHPPTAPRPPHMPSGISTAGQPCSAPLVQQQHQHQQQHGGPSIQQQQQQQQQYGRIPTPPPGPPSLQHGGVVPTPPGPVSLLGTLPPSSGIIMPNGGGFPQQPSNGHARQASQPLAPRGGPPPNRLATPPSQPNPPPPRGGSFLLMPPPPSPPQLPLPGANTRIVPPPPPSPAGTTMHRGPLPPPPASRTMMMMQQPPPPPPLPGSHTMQQPPLPGTMLHHQQQQQTPPPYPQHQQPYQSHAAHAPTGPSAGFQQQPQPMSPGGGMGDMGGSARGGYNKNNDSSHSGGYPVQHHSPMGNGSARGYPTQPSGGMGNGSAREYPTANLQQQQQQPYQDKPKIDPSQIPRPPLFTRPQQDSGILPVYYPKQAAFSDPAHMPPPADSRYVVVDDGNASPDFIRSSVYAFPSHRGVWHHTGDMPLGVLCTPLAAHSADFVPRPRQLPDGASTEPWKDPQAVPVIGQATYAAKEGPPRCGSCHAYLSPFFGMDGTCNLCGNRNRDLAGQPQLTSGLPMQFGTVEYDVAGPYVTRQQGPVQPVSLYALDLTCPDVVAYLPILEQVGLDMATHVSHQRHFSMTGPAPAPPRIGICLVSCAGIVLRHSPDRYAVVSDVTEQPFAPFPIADWTFDLSTSEGVAAWQSFCRNELARDIGEWRQHTAVYKSFSGADGFELSCGGAAMQFLSEALALTGGRGTWISWRRPNFGVGSLPHRDGHPQQQQQQGDDTAPYTPLQLLSDFKRQNEEVAANFYKKLGAACSKNRVSLDVVMMHTRAGMPQLALELATLGELCKVTCGKLSWINALDWQEPLREELTRQVQSFSGWDAVFKVRCSDGIQVKSFYSCGGSLIETMTGGSPELELSSVSPNTCIAVELEHRVGGIPKDRSHVYIQTALLYSTLSGKRRVRVSTLAIRTTSVANETFKSLDFAAVTSLLTRSAADSLRNAPSESDKASLRAKARDLVYNKCIHILASYRKYTPAGSSRIGQLILPQKMQLLPLFCMCLLKSPMLRPSLPRMIPGIPTPIMSPTSDERAFYNWNVGQVMPSFSMLMVHPNVFSVGNLEEAVGQWYGPDELEQVNGFIRMPPTIAPSMESMDDDGVYLIDDGLRVFLYIGRLVADDIKGALLESEPTELKQRLEVLVYQMRVYSSNTRGSESELRPTWAPIVRILQQEGHQSPMEAEVLNLMVADATGGEKDYVDFLCTLHRRIRENVESDKG